MTSSKGLVASLPMYIRSETAKAHHVIWNLIRDDLRIAGVDAPEALTNDGVGYDFWKRPDLLLSQTCGYPFRTLLKDYVHLVGTPDYGLKGCPPGHYYSVFIVHKDSPFRTLGDLDGRPMAYNDDHSQSGYHGPLAYAGSQGINLRTVLESGGHRKSAKAIFERTADVAAIDVITWLDCQRYDPDVTKDLRVIAQTPPVPGLPLICAKSIDPALVLRSVTKVTKQLSETARNTLRIKTIVPTSPMDYAHARFR